MGMLILVAVAATRATTMSVHPIVTDVSRCYPQGAHGLDMAWGTGEFASALDWFLV